MQRPGFYFPFIHIRDDNWLKSAALYWPSVRRLVPHGYKKHDTSTARSFFDAGILQDEDPGELVDLTTWNLLTALQDNTELLVKKYGVERAEEDWRGEVWGEGSEDGRTRALGWIHITKFQPEIVNYLADSGLARLGRSGERWDLHQPGDPWVGLHPALAGAYMTALASRVCERAYFQPLTDQPDLRISTPNSDVRDALGLLLGSNSASQSNHDLKAEAVEAYIMFALQYVRPRNLDAVTAEKVIQCRASLSEELAAFRAYINSQRGQLAEIAAIPITNRRLEEFALHVEQTMEIPLQRLEKALHLHNLDSVRSLVLVSSVAAPILADPVLNMAHATPREGTAAGVVAAVGGAWWSARKEQAQIRTDSPVAYLLDVRDRLSPNTLAGSIRKFFRGTYRGR
jgi:Family of unknown function (DUF6236)